MRAWPGAPYPLGASWDGEGVNFALFSEHAEAVHLDGDVVGPARRVRDQHDRRTCLPPALERRARPGERGASVVHHAPDVAQQRVVAADELGKTLQDAAHGRG